MNYDDDRGLFELNMPLYDLVSTLERLDIIYHTVEYTSYKIDIKEKRPTLVNRTILWE
jgi:hypothetical protein